MMQSPSCLACSGKHSKHTCDKAKAREREGGRGGRERERQKERERESARE